MSDHPGAKAILDAATRGDFPTERDLDGSRVVVVIGPDPVFDAHGGVIGVDVVIAFGNRRRVDGHRRFIYPPIDTDPVDAFWLMLTEQLRASGDLP